MDLYLVVRPEVKLTEVEVKASQIQVKWKFGSNGRRKRTTKDSTYSVGVQIQYKKKSEAEYSVYPADGSRLPAKQVNANYTNKVSVK